MAYASPVNQTGIVSIFEYANSVSSGIFGVGILLALYVIVFMYLKGRGTATENCFAVAGFMTVIPTIFLFLMGLVNNWHLFIAILAAVIPVLLAYWATD